MERLQVGIVGCGNIASRYVAAGGRFENIDIVACADLDMARARALAQEHGIARACSVDEMLADPDISIIVNITIPAAHGEVGLAALKAGKSVYNEKPLAITREEGQRMLALAEEKKLLVGGAPDTFLGGGLQTCRKLIDDGWIGQPIGAAGFMLCRGPESWHPNPDFFYQKGAGPLFDMGPYYLTALVSLLGPVRHLSSSATISFPQRLITSEPHYGESIEVNVPTHVSGVMEFVSGAVGSLTTSFDVWHSRYRNLEIYGSEGTLALPDPNTFGGPVSLRRMGAEDWTDIPLSHGYADQSRGLGVSDMAAALLTGRPHRANGLMAYHVLDIMHTFHDASCEGRRLTLESSCTQPAALPVGLRDGTVD